MKAMHLGCLATVKGAKIFMCFVSWRENRNAIDRSGIQQWGQCCHFVNKLRALGQHTEDRDVQ